MSVNNQTYLKFVHTPFTADTTFKQLSTTKLLVYGLVIGVDDDSASATTGNWVGTSNAITVSNKNGIKVIATSPLSISPASVGSELIAVDLQDYFVATTSGDLIYWSYLVESQQQT